MSPSEQATTTAAPSAGAIDLCGLLTAADVTKALGGSSIEGTLTSTGGYCHWDSARSPNDRVITATQPGTLDDVKGPAPTGAELTVGGRGAYSVRDEAARVQTTWIDVGGQLLLVEIPLSTDAAADLQSAEELAGIAVGNL